MPPPRCSVVMQTYMIQYDYFKSNWELWSNYLLYIFSEHNITNSTTSCIHLNKMCGKCFKKTNQLKQRWAGPSRKTFLPLYQDSTQLNTVARTPQPKVMSYICSLEEEPGGGEETGAWTDGGALAASEELPDEVRHAFPQPGHARLLRSETRGPHRLFGTS